VLNIKLNIPNILEETTYVAYMTTTVYAFFGEKNANEVGPKL